ncbi:MAG: hypothetical protein KR126chlam2_00488 [Chlamydiae bacterium]|nr:hypothetical protein [Chlamydiota bacterium]
MRRRYITLIEMLISLALLSFLLSSLFFWYHHLTIRHDTLAKKKWPLVEERYCDQRLQKLFSHIKLQSPFFTTRDDLVFIFDNGPHPEPLLSHQVLGRLYYDERNNTLSLGVWPLPKEESVTPSENLVLLDRVTSLSFSFYYPPQPSKKTVETEQVGHPVPDEGWQSIWQQAYTAFPAMLKLTVIREGKKEDERLVFAFELPGEQLISYPKEKKV